MKPTSTVISEEFNPLNGINVRVCFRKNMEKKKHLYCHDKNFYYFCKSDIPVIN